MVGAEAALTDYFLVDLAEGVCNWPCAHGIGLLTRTIHFAALRGFNHVKLSQIHCFIWEYNIRLPLQPPMAILGRNQGTHPDIIVRNELEAVITADIERVKQSKKREGQA
jgi:hypothetical protein